MAGQEREPKEPERRSEALSDFEGESSGEEEETDTVSLDKLQALGTLTMHHTDCTSVKLFSVIIYAASYTIITVIIYAPSSLLLYQVL